MGCEAFITGSSIVCALGEDKQECIKKTQSVDHTNYKAFLDAVQTGGSYLLKQKFDSQKQKLQMVLKKCIDDALSEGGYSADERKDFHVFVGSTSMNMGVNEEYNAQFLQGKQNKELVNEGYGIVGDMVKTMVGSIHPPLSFLTACTSAANAMITASQMIQSGQIKKAIVVGVELYNKTTYKGFESLMLISPSKIYKPFDQDSDGIILGEGCSAIVIDSQKKSDANFKFLGGYTISDDYSETTANPDGSVLLVAMQQALNDAKIDLKDVDCIKAHATGSENNNLSEARAIGSLFEAMKIQKPVTAIKSYLGHTLGACGSCESTLMMQAIDKGFIPMTLGFENGLPQMQFEPITEDIKLEKATLLLNFVGFGGSNSSLILSNKDV